MKEKNVGARRRGVGGRGDGGGEKKKKKGVIKGVCPRKKKALNPPQVCEGGGSSHKKSCRGFPQRQLGRRGRRWRRRDGDDDEDDDDAKQSISLRGAEFLVFHGDPRATQRPRRSPCTQICGGRRRSTR